MHFQSCDQWGGLKAEKNKSPPLPFPPPPAPRQAPAVHLSNLIRQSLTRIRGKHFTSVTGEHCTERVYKPKFLIVYADFALNDVIRMVKP